MPSVPNPSIRDLITVPRQAGFNSHVRPEPFFPPLARWLLVCTGTQEPVNTAERVALWWTSQHSQPPILSHRPPNRSHETAQTSLLLSTVGAFARHWCRGSNKHPKSGLLGMNWAHGHHFDNTAGRRTSTRAIPFVTFNYEGVGGYKTQQLSKTRFDNYTILRMEALPGRISGQSGGR